MEQKERKMNEEWGDQSVQEGNNTTSIIGVKEQGG